MARLVKYHFLIGIFIFFASCSTEKAADSVAEPLPIEAEEEFQVSPEMENILAAGEGTFRNVNLGMLKQQVMDQEDTLEILNDSPEMLVYQLTYSPNQTADFEYSFDPSGRLVKIQANLYPTNEEEQKKAFNELIRFYYSKYGEPVSNNDHLIHWKSILGEHELILKRQGNVKVHDISIEINPIVNTPSAVS